MGYKIVYKSSAFKDLKHPDEDIARRILNQLETHMSNNPNCSTPLKGQFKGFLKYHIGNYRVVYTKIKSEVLILRIGHRKDVYE